MASQSEITFGNWEGSAEKLELISFSICPFVQRAVLTLMLKKHPFKLTTIDLRNKPTWFLDMSPLGKVPLLKLADGKILFESSVICEYLDDVLPESKLLPSDPYLRAFNKCWIEVASSLQSSLAQCMMYANNEADFMSAGGTLFKTLSHMEDMITKKEFCCNGPYFSGDKISLVDVAFATLFQRLDLMDQLLIEFGDEPVYTARKLPRVAAWSDQLLHHIPELWQSTGLMLGMDTGVPETTVDEIKNRFRSETVKYLEAKGSYFYHKYVHHEAKLQHLQKLQRRKIVDQFPPAQHVPKDQKLLQQQQQQQPQGESTTIVYKA